MSNVVESYKIGKIQVVISEIEGSHKLHVDCNDGNFHSEFTVSPYELQNYKRHMNQRIKDAYANADEE